MTAGSSACAPLLVLVLLLVLLVVVLLFAPSLFPTPAAAFLGEVQQDVNHLVSSLFHCHLYQHELGRLLARDWKGLWAALTKALAAVDVVLVETTYLLRHHWPMVLLPVCLGLSLPLLVGRLLFGGEALSTTSAHGMVRELGPLGECLEELAALSKEMLQLRNHAPHHN
jgi:hypothetical protein